MKQPSYMTNCVSCNRWTSKAYAKAHNPDWPIENILSAFDHYEANGWKQSNGLVSWVFCPTSGSNFWRDVSRRVF